MKSTTNHQFEHLTQCFDEGVHPSCATSPWSSFHGLGLYIGSGKTTIYKALLLLKPISMCLECRNKLGTHFPKLNLVEICSSYGQYFFVLENLH